VDNNYLDLGMNKSGFIHTLPSGRPTNNPGLPANLLETRPAANIKTVRTGDLNWTPKPTGVHFYSFFPCSGTLDRKLGRCGRPPGRHIQSPPESSATTTWRGTHVPTVVPRGEQEGGKRSGCAVKLEQQPTPEIRRRRRPLA
jgi:hypothetical protein